MVNTNQPSSPLLSWPEITTAKPIMKLWVVFLGVTTFFSFGLTVSVGPTPLFCASATDYCRVGESPSMCECCGSHVMTCVERKAIGLERWYPDDPKLNGWYLRAKPCPLHPSIVSCVDGECNPDAVGS
ncbi:hypothetical protein FALCPG4_003617 [Fusarium falciforme]